MKHKNKPGKLKEGSIVVNRLSKQKMEIKEPQLKKLKSKEEAKDKRQKETSDERGTKDRFTQE